MSRANFNGLSFFNRQPQRAVTTVPAPRMPADFNPSAGAAPRGRPVVPGEGGGPARGTPSPFGIDPLTPRGLAISNNIQKETAAGNIQRANQLTGALYGNPNQVQDHQFAQDANQRANAESGAMVNATTKAADAGAMNAQQYQRRIAELERLLATYQGRDDGLGMDGGQFADAPPPAGQPQPQQGKTLAEIGAGAAPKAPAPQMAVAQGTTQATQSNAGQQGPQPGQTATGPNGQKIKWNGQQWVPFTTGGSITMGGERVNVPAGQYNAPTQRRHTQGQDPSPRQALGFGG